jgi:hypothetical protein
LKCLSVSFALTSLRSSYICLRQGVVHGGKLIINLIIKTKMKVVFSGDLLFPCPSYKKLVTLRIRNDFSWIKKQYKPKKQLRIDLLMYMLIFSYMTCARD